MYRCSKVFLLALLPLFAGCPSPTCLQSSDIQVNVVPDDPSTQGAIASLHVSLSIEGGQPKSHVIAVSSPLGSGSAFILRPDTPPAKASYKISITITAMDAQSQLVAIGSDTEEVLASGCNIMTVHLTMIPSGPSGTGPDLSFSSGGDGSVTNPNGDMSGIITPISHDMAGCIGGMPDEDNDGRANSCDACPADADANPTNPPDSDGDGLPDVCDPDVNTSGNRLLYFDPFDNNTTHWVGDTFTMHNSFMQIDSPHVSDYNDSKNVGNGVDLLPLNVRVQTFFLPIGIYTSPQNNELQTADAAIFIGSGTDPSATGTNGVLCQIRLDRRNNNMNDAIRIVSYVNGMASSCNSTLTDTATTPSCSDSTTRFTFPQQSTLYRLRLTQRGNSYTCEAFDVDDNLVFSPATLTATAGGTQNIVLQETNMQAQFNSVVAETALQ
jgi:hypothetical protein